jgi:outer membrane protein TolC
MLAGAAVLSGCAYDTSAYRPPREAVSAIENLDLPERPRTPQEAQEAATLPTTLPATQPAQEQPLTLQQVRELALRHNLELEIVRLDPAIAAQELRAEEAAFEAVFTTDANYSWLDQPVGGRVVAGQVVGSQIERASLVPGVTQPLRTGGRIDASLPMERLENKNELGPGEDPTSYESDFSLRFTQPLAEGFGEDVNALGIRLATVGLGQAQVRRKLEVINILSTADRTYWLLYAARRAVEVQRQQHTLAVQQLERARRQLAAGAQTQVEVIRAESDVANALELVIQAENLVRERERALKRILNAPELEMGGRTTVIPETLPAPVLYELDSDRLTGLAMERRMELLEAELSIAGQTAQMLAARNRTLPRADLLAGWNVNGRGGNLSDSLDQTGTRDFQDYDLGIALEVPLGNQRARADLRAAILRRMQALATKESRMLQIRQEVLDAADRLETAWHRIVATRRAVELAARLLEAQTRQFDLGLNTGLEVSTARADLAQAQFSEIEALTEYEIARVDLAVATGTVIGKDRILLGLPGEGD